MTEQGFQNEINKFKEQIEKWWQEAEKSVMPPQYVSGKLSAYSDVLEYLEFNFGKGEETNNDGAGD